MRKALHEEVSKEITDKSVHIAVKMAKPVLDDFMKALSDAVKKPVKAAGHAIGQKIHPTEGKQSVKTLIRQGQGVSSIPLADEGLKDFQKIAKKNMVLILQWSKTRIQSLQYIRCFSRQRIRMQSPGFFDDYYSAKQIKKSSVEKISVMEKLKKFKEIVAAIPKKVAERRKRRGRDEYEKVEKAADP